MRHLVRLPVLSACAFLFALPAGAQYGRTSSRRGAALEIPPVAPSVAALAVRHGGDLQLSQTQLETIQAVRQRQDSANAPWLRSLDSLRNGPRPVNPLDLSQEQRELLAARRASLTAALDAMRATDAEARTKVMAVLTSDQQHKAARLENHAQELARVQSQRRADDPYRGQRRGDMDERIAPLPED